MIGIFIKLIWLKQNCILASTLTKEVHKRNCITVIISVISINMHHLNYDDAGCGVDGVDDDDEPQIGSI